MVLDEHETEVLSYASVYVQELGTGVETDEDGMFSVSGICDGPLTLRFSHIGCDPEIITLDFKGDTSLTVYLHHHDNYTETVTVIASAAADYEERLDRKSDMQLSQVLESINGISSLRTGAATAKPVYDGLFGNRLPIQNNGITQAGQQWGNDHAPEIDPWVAAYVSVVEGVDALRYGGGTLGASVLVEPAELTRRTEYGGKVAYGLRSNGLGHTLNARVTDSAFVSYRISGSLKLVGDHRAPDYYLKNTGRREGNVAIQLAKYLDSRWTARTYYSMYNAGIGVLRGSHVGNLADLREAIGRDVPYFTENRFSYRIASPRQSVSHHLLKAELSYQPARGIRYALRYGGQLDDRKEFDVRRGDDDQAALKLLQITHYFEARHTRDLGGRQHIEAGLQYENTDNENQPGTGILPLIPQFNGNRLAAYATYHHNLEKIRYHFGGRYEWQDYRVVSISRDLPRRLLRNHLQYGALGAGAGASLPLSKRFSAEADLTFRERAPQINELYSQGLHQGVSGIEEGDSSLSPERSTKITMGLQYGSKDGSLTLRGSVFAQRIANYINLEPQEELRLTLRGAFPVFIYRGVDASLSGAKLTMLARLGEFDVDSRLTLLRGDNRTDQSALIFLPPANWRTTVSYLLPAQVQARMTVLYTAKSGRIVEGQDLLPPPPAYTLFDFGLSRTVNTGAGKLDFSLEAENILNTSYRDYLDRQRYFADAVGRSINFRVAYSW